MEPCMICQKPCKGYSTFHGRTWLCSSKCYNVHYGIEERTFGKVRTRILPTPNGPLFQIKDFKDWYGLGAAIKDLPVKEVEILESWIRDNQRGGLVRLTYSDESHEERIYGIPQKTLRRYHGREDNRRRNWKASYRGYAT